MKKLISFILFLTLILTSFAPATSAQENSTANLSPQEQKIVAELQSELNKHLPKKRSALTEADWEKSVLDIAFDFGFVRSNPLFSMVASLDGTPRNTEYDEWYENLTNKSQRELTVYDSITKKNIRLVADYIDNKSPKTVVVHHGYRSSPQALFGETKMFSELGYNVLIPNARSHSQSEGEYITFGYYEKDDLNKWINQEAALKPNQQVILYGVSMGAATTMLSQQTPNKNVIGYIEDCGYYSLTQQLKDTIQLLTKYFRVIPYLNQINWANEEDRLISLLNEYKIKPILGFDLAQVTPLESVKTSNIPKLFIHGSNDWFIPPVAMEKLYTAAPGYKEKLLVPFAAHAQSFPVNKQNYENKVKSFLANIEPKELDLPKVSEINNRSTLITVEAEPNVAYHVTVNDPSGKFLKEYKGQIPAFTNKTLISTNPLPEGTQVITTIQKGVSKSKPVTVVVKDVIAPPIPKLNTIKTTDTNITGETEKNAKVTIKTNAGKILATGYADDHGKFNIAIGKQEYTTRILATATDKVGNESLAAAIYVEKDFEPQNWWDSLYSIIKTILGNFY